MSRKVTVYFDYKSPYSYLAFQEIKQLESTINVEFDWIPYVLDVVDAYGAVEDRSQVEWNEVKYLYKDVRRWANKKGLIVKGPKKIYDTNFVSQAALYAKKMNKLNEFSEQVFTKFWNHQLDVEDQMCIRKILTDLSLDEQAFDHFISGEGKDLLANIRQEAQNIGVFGIPSFIYEGELFWGYDRIPLLMESIQNNNLKT